MRPADIRCLLFRRLYVAAINLRGLTYASGAINLPARPDESHLNLFERASVLDRFPARARTGAALIDAARDVPADQQGSQQAIFMARAPLSARTHCCPQQSGTRREGSQVRPLVCRAALCDQLACHNVSLAANYLPVRLAAGRRLPTAHCQVAGRRG